MNKKIKNVYQFLLTLLSILCLTIFCEVAIVKTFLLSSNHWVTEAENSKYINNLTQSINESIQDIGMASGIKKGGLKNVISEADVEKDFNHFVTNAFIGQTYDINKEAVGDTIRTAVEEYAKKENKPINEINQASVNQFVEQGVTLYNGKIHNPIVSTIGLRVTLINRLTNFLLLGSGIFLVVLVICLYFAGTRYKHVFIRNLAYLVTSTGLLLVSFTLFLTIKKPLAKLSVLDNSMKSWISASFQSPIIIQIIISVVFLLSGITLSIYSYKEYKKLEKRGFRRKNQAI
ncbi:hypothetical protein BW731_06975 [Vagococcus martis]|uniref:Uncharacterized protein n=1 Tax=Vagococcus martis TaxID=1768210 RepID=A0A1V4DHD8_9ENTE|nr:hypothetical protein [Vagococcus martis]OPF87929.1 hypothetical protein BW731_06975 [Vagococcus martis]